jgi:hypothetical protein
MEPDFVLERAGDGARLRDLLVCLEASVYADLGDFDLELEWCECSLSGLLRRGASSATKEEMMELGAVLRGLEYVLISGLVMERFAAKWARDGATEAAGMYSIARRSVTCVGGTEV